MRRSVHAFRSLAPRAAAAFVFSTALVLPAFAADKPPLSPDQAAPARTPSTISATIQFSLPALSRAIEQKVPHRLANFDDRTTECWHRRILGREVNVDCVYSGYIERVGSIPLRAEAGRITAATPLFGTVSARGSRGLAALVHGTAEGEMTVFASARPRLLKDWSVSLDMSDGFHWIEPPTLSVLGFRINLQRYVEPKVEQQLARMKAEFERTANGLDIRKKAETAWHNAFVAMPLSESPPVWLQTTPQSIAFSGFRAHGNVLEGSIEISGTAETVIGAQPAAAATAPTPLPPLGNEVSHRGKFSIILPVSVGYELLAAQVRDIAAGRAQALDLGLQDVKVYPSSGKIVAGLHLARSGATSGDWIYLTATPRIDTRAHLLQLSGLSFNRPSLPDESPLTKFAGDPQLMQALLQQVRLSLEDRLQTMMASASAGLNRPLGDGFRSEGRITEVSLSQVLLLADGVRVDMRASGNLSIIYGL